MAQNGHFWCIWRPKQHKNALAMSNLIVKHGILFTISENVPYELVFSDKTQDLAKKKG